MPDDDDLPSTWNGWPYNGARQTPIDPLPAPPDPLCGFPLPPLPSRRLTVISIGKGWIAHQRLPERIKSDG